MELTFIFLKKTSKKMGNYWYSKRILSNQIKSFENDHNKLNLGFEKYISWFL